MNYLTLLVILASLSVFFTLQALYWIAKSKRDKRSALLDQRLGTHESEDSEYEGLIRDEVEGDWAIRLSQLMRAAGDQGDVSSFFQKVLIYASIAFLVGLMLSKSIVAGILFALAGGYLPYAQLKGKRDQRIDQIEQQLPEALEMMIISLRAGQSLEQTRDLRWDAALNLPQKKTDLTSRQIQFNDERGSAVEHKKRCKTPSLYLL